MKITLTILLALLAFAVLHMARWQIVTAGGSVPTVYRLDRLTGRVDASMAGQAWRSIKSPHVNGWGDEAVD